MNNEIKKNTTLGKYLFDNGIKQNAFSKRIRVSDPTLTQFIMGRRMPTLAVAYRVQKETGGKVKMTDFLKPEDI